MWSELSASLERWLLFIAKWVFFPLFCVWALGTALPLTTKSTFGLTPEHIEYVYRIMFLLLCASCVGWFAVVGTGLAGKRAAAKRQQEYEDAIDRAPLLEELRDLRNWSRLWNDEARRKDMADNPRSSGDLWYEWQKAREQFTAELIERKCDRAHRLFGEDPAILHVLYQNHVTEFQKRYELACKLEGVRPDVR